MEVVKVIVVDYDEDFRKTLEYFLNKQEDIEVMASLENGEKAINFIQKNDVDIVITDLVMPKIDGIGILESVMKKDKSKRPTVIILSAISKKSIINRTINIGACYYCIKPFDMNVLAKRIRSVYSLRKQKDQTDAEESRVYVESNTSLRLKKLEERITDIIANIGIPVSMKGYKYIRSALTMAMSNPKMLTSMTKSLYPGVAKECQTTSSKVERCIRNTIEIVWERGPVEELDKIFGYTINSKKGKPTNREFIAKLVYKVQMEYRQQL